MPPNPHNLSELSQSINESPAKTGQSNDVGIREQAELMAKISCDRASEEVEGLIQDRGERKKYADKSFNLVCFWVAAVLLILLLEGFLSQGIKITIDAKAFEFSFKLSDSVLLAVVGGTTASVISIFIVVANYLFPKRK